MNKKNNKENYFKMPKQCYMRQKCSFCTGKLVLGMGPALMYGLDTH